VEAAPAAAQGNQASRRLGGCCSAGTEEHGAAHPLQQQLADVATFEDRSRPCEGAWGAVLGNMMRLLLIVMLLPQ
jgi:hypothetical protein